MKRNKCLAVLALKRFSTIAFHLAALLPQNATLAALTK
jgi:hypothetical protein